MKIYTIIVCPLSSAQKSFSASMNGSLLKMDPHEKAIRENIKIDKLKNLQGIHQLKPATNKDIPPGIYYAFITEERICLLATDEKLAPHAQDAFFKKLIMLNNSTELTQLIQKPIEAFKSDFEKMAEASQQKINNVNQDLNEIKQIMLENIDKLLERGEKIEVLQAKAESIAKDALRFKKESNKLKNRYACPGLFYFFTTIKNLVWKDSYEYEYRPLPKPNP